MNYRSCSLQNIQCKKFDSERGVIIDGIFIEQDNITLWEISSESWSYVIHNIALEHKNGEKNLDGAPLEFPSGGPNRVILETNFALKCAFYDFCTAQDAVYKTVSWRNLCDFRYRPKVDIMAPLDKSFRVHPQGSMYLLLDPNAWKNTDKLILGFQSEIKIREYIGRGRKSVRGKYKQTKVFGVFQITDIIYEIERIDEEDFPKLKFTRTIGDQFQRSKVLKSLN